MSASLYRKPRTEAERTAHEHISWAIREGLTPREAVALIADQPAPTWDHAFAIVERAAAGLEQPTRRAA